MSTLPQPLHVNSLAKTMPYAAFLHILVIFGLGFGIQSSSNIKNATLLDISIVNTHADKAPDKAEFIAQANQEASGATDIKNRPRSMMASENLLAPDEISPLESSKATPNKPPVLFPLLLTTKGETFKRSPKLEEQPDKPEPPSDAKEVIDETREEARLVAELAKDEANYSKMPRTRFLNSSNAKSAVEASYIDAWAKKIERIGTTNFPQEAIRLRKNGKLIINATLNQQGRIIDSQIHTSSGSRILDNAALRIIKIASPYDALPRKVLEHFDQLQITRTFIFDTGYHDLRTE
ncbi:MAG: energy transducer TonB [Thiotrichaceae bacterium]